MSKKSKKIEVQGSEITVIATNEQDYISLTDMVRDIDNGLVLIEKWLRNKVTIQLHSIFAHFELLEQHQYASKPKMNKYEAHLNSYSLRLFMFVHLAEQLRNKNTIEFLGIWEEIYNPRFNSPEFEGIKNQAGLNRFALSVKQWVNKTNSIGIIAKAGRYGGTYAHKDIAFEFASWISPKFKIFLIKEFQRLKDEEQKQLGWDIKRNLTKINYRIHTDAIKENLIPKNLSKKQIYFVYANEADILNMALFGKTAKQWRDENPKEKGNIRDFANVSQLVCLANLENLNAVFINDGLEQSDRLLKLNQIAISQMKILLTDKSVKMLNPKSDGADEQL